VTNYAELLRTSNVPVHLHDGLVGYLVHGCPPGSFLTAVLMNDLVGAIAHADDVSAAHLQPLVRWLYRYAPANAWGSCDTVHLWVSEFPRRLQPEAR